VNPDGRRLLGWLAALVAAGIGAWATTQGDPGVPPTTLGVLALGAVALATAAVGGLPALGRPPVRRAVLVCWGLAVASVAAQDFLRPGITRGHDLEPHAWALWSLWRCVLDGDLWPRWNPYLALGVPLLQFYAPLAYVTAWPAQLIGASPYEALAFQMVAAQALSVATAWWAVRGLGGSRAGASLAGLALALAPYHLLDQTFRLALGETLALAILPVPMAAAVRLLRGERGRVAWAFGAGLVAVLLTHVLSAILLGIALALLVAGSLVAERARVRRLPALVAAGVLAVAASAAWSLPVVVEAPATSISKLSKPGKAISPFAAASTEPLRRRAWRRYGVRKRLDESKDPGASMPLYAGWGLLTLAALGVAAPRRRDRDADLGSAEPPPARLFGASALLLVALAADPAARLLDGLPVVGRIMFPWRLLSPASVAGALAAGCALDRWLAPGRPRQLGLAAAAVLVAADATPYLGAAQRLPDREGHGLVHEARGTLHPVDVPRDVFVRVEDLALPPDDYDWRVARARRAFPEYMTPKLRHAYGKRTRPPSVERSQGYGAGLRFRKGRPRPEPLTPEPLVRFRPEGGRWRPLPAATWTLEPERIDVTLPAGLPAGRVRFASAWFPGWDAVVAGRSQPATASKSLLAVDVPAATESVGFRYRLARPWDRPVGLLITAGTLLGLAWRRRRG
jgi:hypothetical protein